MLIVKVEPYANNSHANQTWSRLTIPEGYAVLPENIRPEHFPFFEIIGIENGIITSVRDGVYPEADVIPAKKLREEAYNYDLTISWGGELITVTKASELWQFYSSEGSEKASELQSLIAAAKKTIREQYPD